ncbi:hypothetical protein GF312_13735 [Candidatus Poribacteria bacterium]|nr:hypothetical protein [Candidatus Poribacteria bacterium]
MGSYDSSNKENSNGFGMLFWRIGLMIFGFIVDLFTSVRRTRVPDMSEDDEIQNILENSANVLQPEGNPNLPGSGQYMQSSSSEYIKRQVNQKSNFDSESDIYVPKNKADEGAYHAMKALQETQSAVVFLKTYRRFRSIYDDEWMTGFWEELNQQNPEMADYIEKSYMQSLGGTTNECHPSKFESLNNGIIPDDMRNGFKQAGASLSDAATLSIKRKDHSWVINDGDNSYTIWKENGRISIYRLRLTFGTEGKPYMKNGLHTEQDYIDFAQDIRIWFDKLGTPPQDVAAFILRQTKCLKSRHIDIIVRHQSPEVKRLIKAQTKVW